MSFKLWYFKFSYFCFSPMAAPPARARADYDYLIKLLLIGDSGETPVLFRFLEKQTDLCVPVSFDWSHIFSSKSLKIIVLHLSSHVLWSTITCFGDQVSVLLLLVIDLIVKLSDGWGEWLLNHFDFRAFIDWFLVCWLVMKPNGISNLCHVWIHSWGMMVWF